MRTVELCPGIRSSVLGFGCAPIGGSVGGEVARRALATALDEGITHFDLARSYGYGDAESFVGGYLKSRRDEVVLATKFGIVATPQARLLRPIKPLVRWAKQMRSRQSPTAGTAVTGSVAFGDRFHKRLPITADNMRASLEKSLRALKTDRVDYLFIHEPHETILDIEALAAEAASLKRAGKIIAWGVAFMRDRQEQLESVLEKADVLQYNLSPGADAYVAIRSARSDKPNVFFSPFRGAPDEMPRDVVLRTLTTDFPKSVVLCSMFSEKHIRANAALF